MQKCNERPFVDTARIETFLDDMRSLRQAIRWHDLDDIEGAWDRARRWQFDGLALRDWDRLAQAIRGRDPHAIEAAWDRFERWTVCLAKTGA